MTGMKRIFKLKSDKERVFKMIDDFLRKGRLKSQKKGANNVPTGRTNNGFPTVQSNELANMSRGDIRKGVVGVRKSDKRGVGKYPRFASGTNKPVNLIQARPQGVTKVQNGVKSPDSTVSSRNGVTPLRIKGDSYCVDKKTGRKYESVSPSQMAQLGMKLVPKEYHPQLYGVQTEPNNMVLRPSMTDNGIYPCYLETQSGLKIYTTCDSNIDLNTVPVYVGTGKFENGDISKDSFSDEEREFRVYRINKNDVQKLIGGVKFDSSDGSLILSNSVSVPLNNVVQSTIKDLVKKGVKTVYYRNRENSDGTYTLSPIDITKK